MINKLDNWGKCVDPLLNGSESLYEDVPSESHPYIYSEISFEKGLVSELLVEMFNSIRDKSQKLFKDFLPDNKFFSPSTELYNISNSCPTNNITLEKLMAQVDRSVSHAPNANVKTIESKILFNDNETDSWLKSKTAEEKYTIIKNAMLQKKEIKKKKRLKKKPFNKNIQKY